MPPHIFIRASDYWPYDTRLSRFRRAVQAEELEKPTSFLRKYRKDRQNIENKFSIVTIAAKTKGPVNMLGLPALFRPHWSKVLTDDTDVTQTTGGHAYERFGIAQDWVTLVVVRPDGFVDTIVPASRYEDVNEYFAGFMRVSA